MTVVVQRSIDVDAPAPAVWAVLVDVERWPEWTASMSWLQRPHTGSLVVGEKIVVCQPRLGTRTWTVTEVDDGRSFTWESASPGVRTVAEHVLTPRIAGGCTATLRVTQRGPAARLVGAVLDRLTRRYLRMEAEGLKARSESRRSLSGNPSAPAIP
jgi:uncharacterized protein YndB with AHSA1/START domain